MADLLAIYQKHYEDRAERLGSEGGSLYIYDEKSQKLKGVLFANSVLKLRAWWMNLTR